MKETYNTQRTFLERNPIAAIITVAAFIAAYAGLFAWGLQ